MVDYRTLAAAHRAAVTKAAAAGKARQLARHNFTAAERSGASTERLTYLDALCEQADATYRAASERAEEANAAATAANPNAGVTR